MADRRDPAAIAARLDILGWKLQHAAQDMDRRDAGAARRRIQPLTVELAQLFAAVSAIAEQDIAGDINVAAGGEVVAFARTA